MSTSDLARPHACQANPGPGPAGPPPTLQAWPRIGPDQHQAVADVIRSGRLVDGPATSGLEQAWADRLHRPARQVLAVSSGTHAITLALQALDVGPGDKVVVPAYTFSGSVFPILQAGAAPVFVDTHLDRHTLNIEQAWAAARDSAVKAVIAVHLHGSVVDVDLLASGLPDRVRIVEDACQAHGSSTTDSLGRTEPVGLRGDASAWSLNTTKALPAGEGGLLHLQTPGAAATARTLRRFGEDWDETTPREYLVTDPRGGNGRIDEMSAAFGLSQLPHLDHVTARARANAHLLRTLLDTPAVTHPAWQDGHSWQKYLVRLPDRQTRDEAMRRATHEGLPVCLWQRAPLSRHPAFRAFDTVDDRDAFTTLETSLLLFTERHPLLAQEPGTVTQIARRLTTLWSSL